MNTNGTQVHRAAAAAQAQHQSAAHAQQAQAHRPGDQVARYKGATLRTAFATVKPGGMARAMLAKLKPRPGPARAEGEGVEPAAGDEPGARRAGEGEVAPVHGQPERHGRHDPRREGDDEEPPHEDDDGGPTVAGRPRHRARSAVRPPAGVRPAGDALRALWATSALGAGGEAALRRALASRLFQAARGPGTTGWRQPWLGNVGALYAAAGAARFDADGRGLQSVREVLVELSGAVAPGQRLLPNPMRATFFCLLPLVLLDLQRPRTARQRHDLLVRLAVLARPPARPRQPF